MHAILDRLHFADPTIHRDTGERVGIEVGEGLLLLQQLDHVPSGGIHRLVHVGVASKGHKVISRLSGRPRLAKLLARVL